MVHLKCLSSDNLLIAKELNIPAESVTKRISYWVARGILKEESAGVWKTLSDGDEVIVQGQDLNEETPEQLELERKRAELEETQQAVWQYIRGMLQNLGQIQFTRLEKMLANFGSFNPQLKIETPALIDLLQKKEKEGIIISDNGTYKLKRS